jgi:hypothetical protein
MRCVQQRHSAAQRGSARPRRPAALGAQAGYGSQLLPRAFMSRILALGSLGEMWAE